MLKLLETLSVDKGLPNDLADKNINGKGKKKNLDSSDKTYLKEAFTLLAQILHEYNKKHADDTAQKTLVQDIAKKQQNTQQVMVSGKADEKAPKKEMGTFGKLLLGALAIFGGLAALVMGLMSDDQFKGTLKILSKLGISGGVKLISKSLTKFVASLSKIIKIPMNFLKTYLRTTIKNLSKTVTGYVAKVFPKLGGSFIGKIIGGAVKILKPLATILKKLPVVGTIISFGFAISRFRNGDIRGGVIDVLSGLAVLVPGVGTALSIGLDVLNAYLDFKGGGEQPKKVEKKGNILTDMAKSVGNFLWENAIHVPILGTIRYMGEAYDAFMAGNYMDALGLLGQSIISIVPGGGLLIRGIEAMMGWFGSSSTESSKLKPLTDWMGGVKNWIANKMKSLPWAIQKALSWLGITSDPDGTESITPSSSNEAEETKKRLKAQIDKYYNGIVDGTKSIIDGVKNVSNSITDWAKGTYNKTKEYIKENKDKVINWAKDAYGKTKDYLSEKTNSVVNWTKGVFSRGKTLTSNVVEKTKEDISIASSKIFDTSKPKSPEYNAIVNVIPSLCREILLQLRRMESLVGGSGAPIVMNTNVSQKVPTGSSSQLTDMPDNRTGYVSSHYAFT